LIYWSIYGKTRQSVYRESNKAMKTLLNLIILVLLTFECFSQDANFREKEYSLTKGIAISGYDPVAYFLGKPQKGKVSNVYIYEGINYQFANATNLETFKKNPVKYEPQYGGWCAYAMGKTGEKVEIDPETFKILNGKLYLFYHTFFNNTLLSWNKNENALKAKADANWGKLVNGKHNW
jgi:YHS domain-containing protein